jgi:hypothetical protein
MSRRANDDACRGSGFYVRVAARTGYLRGLCPRCLRELKLDRNGEIPRHGYTYSTAADGSRSECGGTLCEDHATPELQEPAPVFYAAWSDGELQEPAEPTCGGRIDGGWCVLPRDHDEPCAAAGLQEAEPAPRERAT